MKTSIKLIISLMLSINLFATSTTIDTKEYLSQYEISMEVAKDFIMNNYLNNLELVFNTCKTYNISNDMIADILQNDIPGLTAQSVLNYFNNNGFNGEELNNVINENDNNSLTYKIVDTNQSKCYNSSSGNETTCLKTGYDADYKGNEPSYIINEKGTIVTDTVTNLMWTQSTDLDEDGKYSDDDDKLSYENAISYCSNLNLEGYSDWRLPDIKTLYSLIDFTGEDPSSYVGADTSSLITFLSSNFTRAFGDQENNQRIIDGQYATSTKYVSTTMNADETMFGVNFIDGRIKGYPTRNKEYYILCVRGDENYGKNNFIDNNNETISDKATGLMWQKNDIQSTNFEDAISICENATTADNIDWRLPNIKELHSIVDYSKSPDATNSAAIDSIFNASSFINEGGETDWGYYWSNTTHASMQGGQGASYISFGKALGYMNGSILDVHGAGAQRSNNKQNIQATVNSETGYNNKTFSYHGPQGDILRIDNMVRCVRDDK